MDSKNIRVNVEPFEFKALSADSAFEESRSRQLFGVMQKPNSDLIDGPGFRFDRADVISFFSGSSVFSEKLFTITASTRVNFENSRDEASFASLLRRRLLPVFSTDYIEPGYISRADQIFAEMVAVNRLAALAAMNQLFLEFYDDERISPQVVLLIGRLRLSVVGSIGVTTATAALASRRLELIEAGIRAFEHWGSSAHVGLLQSVEITPRWLSDYRDQVIQDIGGARDDLACTKSSIEQVELG